MTITNKEILEAVEILKSKLPNGEITLLKKAVEDLQIGQDEIKDDISDLKERLLNPDGGIVSRVNKNSENRRYWEDRSDDVEHSFANLRGLMYWKDGVNKALWILFATIISIIVKLVFFNGIG